MSKMPGQILIAYDFSDSSALALRHALNLALAEGREREFHFLLVLDPHKGIGLRPPKAKVDYTYAEEVQTLAAQEITNAFNDVGVDQDINTIVHVRIGDPAQEILAVADEIGAHLIVMGSHGRKGLKKLVLGSVSERVVREAQCPVTVTRERTYADVKRDKIVDATADQRGEHYVAPHRFHYTPAQGTKRDKAWVLY
jgi:nucleotide-binding universal stress UspA family protein